MMAEQERETYAEKNVAGDAKETQTPGQNFDRIRKDIRDAERTCREARTRCDSAERDLIFCETILHERRKQLDNLLRAEIGL